MILKLTVILLVACVADFALRKTSTALRHLIWALALFGSLLLPLGNLYVPRVTGDVFVIHSQAAGLALSTPPMKPGWLITVYFLGVALFLCRLLLDALAAARLVRNSRPASLPRVRISDKAVIPFAWGSIVVPAGYEGRAAVLAHEAAHLERGDVWTTLMAQIACAVYWFHPLVWWAAARMRLEADRACDDAVLRAGFADTGYAAELVGVARNLTSVRLAPGAVERSELDVRIRHILSRGVNRSRLGISAAIAATLICFAVLSPVSAITQRPLAKLYRMGHGVSAPSLLHKVDPEYSHDARAHKISGTVLLSITVGSDGWAHDISVVRPLTPDLNDRAIAAVKKWKFKPGMKNNEPVDVKATIEINYRLK